MSDFDACRQRTSFTIKPKNLAFRMAQKIEEVGSNKNRSARHFEHRLYPEKNKIKWGQIYEDEVQKDEIVCKKKETKVDCSRQMIFRF
mmetsp:Transcript_7568/g.16405  ORF Transcript_7568/g.16405 Transcript_7568/m.16405 type:complete len:88 (-) Transcript_7568:469-732(-)